MTDRPWLADSATMRTTTDGALHIVVHPPQIAWLVGWWFQGVATVIFFAAIWYGITGRGGWPSVPVAALVMTLGWGLRDLRQEVVAHPRRREVTSRYVARGRTLPSARRVLVSAHAAITIRRVPAGNRRSQWLVELGDAGRGPVAVARLNSPALADEVAGALATALDLPRA